MDEPAASPGPNPVLAGGREYGLAVAHWFAEIVVGLTPLIGWVAVHGYAELPWILMRCPAVGPRQIADCDPANDGPGAEICILVVVISGLALLPLSHPRQGRPNPLRTVTSACLSSLTLMGGILYGLIAAGISRDTGGVAIWLLAGALLGSLFVALERAEAR